MPGDAGCCQQYRGFPVLSWVSVLCLNWQARVQEHLYNVSGWVAWGCSADLNVHLSARASATCIQVWGIVAVGLFADGQLPGIEARR